MMLHVGFSSDFVNWVEVFYSYLSLSLFINGSASSFFPPSRGLRQGCPLFPLLFILIAEGLSRCLLHERESGRLKGIKMGENISITHLLFVDDVLLFGDGSLRDAQAIHQALYLYCKATGMEVNHQKSCIIFHRAVEGQERAIQN